MDTQEQPFQLIRKKIDSAVEALKSAAGDLHKLSGQPGVELGDLAALEISLMEFAEEIKCFSFVDVERFEAINRSIVEDNPDLLDKYVENNLFPHIDAKTGGNLVEALAKFEAMTGTSAKELRGMFARAITNRKELGSVLKGLMAKLSGSSQANRLKEMLEGAENVEVISGNEAEALLRALRERRKSN